MQIINANQVEKKCEVETTNLEGAAGWPSPLAPPPYSVGPRGASASGIIFFPSSCFAQWPCLGQNVAQYIWNDRDNDGESHHHFFFKCFRLFDTISTGLSLCCSSIWKFGRFPLSSTCCFGKSSFKVPTASYLIFHHSIVASLKGPPFWKAVWGADALTWAGILQSLSGVVHLLMGLLLVIAACLQTVDRTVPKLLLPSLICFIPTLN